MSQIRTATNEDLADILGWLKAEEAESGEGFYCNRNFLADAYKEGRLYAYLSNDGVGAFLALGRTEISIQEVRPDLRGKGIGKALAQFGIDRLTEEGICVIGGECSPSSSMGFWKKMGYSQIEDSKHVYLIVPKKIPLPEGAQSATVQVWLYPEEAKYRDNVGALRGWVPKAVYTSKDEIQLDQRVVFYDARIPGGKDPVAMILVDGNQVYFDKAKYQKGKHHGIRRSPCDNYYIERIFLPAPLRED